MVLSSSHGKTGGILAVLIVIVLFYPVSAAPDTGTLVVTVTDVLTGEKLDGARVYLDGGYKGTTTSTQAGAVLSLSGVTNGKHTVRITRTGYRERTEKIVFPEKTKIEIGISKGFLVPLTTPGPTAERIDIVFYPSSTSYDCKNHAKVSVSDYITDEARFREDVTRLISQTLLNLNNDTSGSTPVVANYQDVFNFYYYYDPAAPADAFNGCSGTIPEKYYTEVPFNDVTVILYPTYYGVYSDATCQPTGCFQDFGPGRSLMKAPADKTVLFKHESGHAVFDLVDTYCGNTYYYQNDPYPNVWSSLEACRSDARAGNRDPGLCRQIQKTSSTATSCIRNYWQWDPQPDIMANGYAGKFGEAATQRMNYVIAQAGGGTL
jgi:hypothetical protein